MTRTKSRTAPNATHLWLTDEDEHCALLAERPEAFVIGYILDQQVTVQKAFRAPADLLDRLGSIDPDVIANTELEKLIEVFQIKPALHRFPKAMAERVQRAMQIVVDKYDGDASRIWRDAKDIDDLYARLAEIPGLGGGKRVGIASVLAQLCDLPITGWEKDIPSWGSLGEVRSKEDLRAYQARKREAKKALKAAAK